MTWLQRYRLRSFLQSSFWILPVTCLLAALLIAPLLRWLDQETRWAWFHFSPDGARAVLGALASSMLTFIIFVLSSMLVVVQLASAQLTPRIIALVFAQRLSKVALGIFSFAYTYTLAALGRVEDTVPQLPVAVAVLSNLVCIAIFFIFVYHLGTGLRPIAVLLRVANEGRAVVESVYPQPFDPAQPAKERTGDRLPPEACVIPYDQAAGVVLAFSPREIVALARQADLVVELVPQVGDFIAKGDPLFRVIGGRDPWKNHAFRQCVAIGPERTLEQDPRFAFRIMVDIANKALSPAINDPTTAVLALDQIHRLLHYVGKRQLDPGEVPDADGKPRLFCGTPDWTDYVCLAVSEIRQYGASSLQVARRLRAMLEHLIRVLPQARREPLQQELNLLHRAVKRGFSDEEDRVRADVGDYQGVGGSEGSRTV